MSTVTPAPRLDAKPTPESADVDERSRLTIPQALLAVWAFLLTLAFSNDVYNWFTTPKSALDLLTLGPGLVLLVVLAVRRDPAAWFASGFLVVAAAATAFSDVPAMAFFGEYFSQNGWLLLAVVVGAWALGRCLGAGMESALGSALIAGAVVNAIVGWIELSTDLGIDGLGPVGGRAAGLMTNPVFFGGFLAGVLWLVLDREHRAARPVVWLAVTALLVGAVQLSGSRIALGMVLVTVAWFALVHLRDDRRLRALLLLVVVVAGIALSTLPSGSTASAGARVDSGASSGFAPRAAIWRSAIEAVADRPLLGYGPGRFQIAVTSRRPSSIVAHDGPDVLYSDAHNTPIEILTTTGILGLILFVLWLVSTARRARGPLVGFVVVVGITMLLEPASVGLTPLVGLALGVAAAVTRRVDDFSRRGRQALAIACSVSVLLGAVAAADLVSGDVAFARAVRTRSLFDLSTAARRFPPWPQVYGLRAAIIGGDAQRSKNRTQEQEALRAQRTAVARDPSDPRLWAALAELEIAFGSKRDAVVAYEHALRLDPWSLFAAEGLYQLSADAGNHAAIDRYRRLVCEISPTRCPAKVQDSGTEPGKTP